MKCVICETECAGQTCSGACRAKLSRQNKRTQDEAHGVDAIDRAHAHTPSPIEPPVGCTHKPTRPPCTPSQMTSPCHACADHAGCSYRKNQTIAVPGDAEYVGVV